jgi:hypothetical protein
MQTSSSQIGRLLRQERAVGRQREIVKTRNSSQLAHEMVEILPKQRFPSCQPHLLDSERHEDPHKTCDLLKS